MVGSLHAPLPLLDLRVCISVVQFKNQAKSDLANKPKKRFINDSIRSYFHRSFMNRYVG